MGHSACWLILTVVFPLIKVENTKFGKPLVDHFYHELALYLSRAAIMAGNADPLQFVKSLYAKGT